MFASRMLSVNDINNYMTGIFMYQCINGNTPEVFDICFKGTMMCIVMTRNANDLHVPYARLDIRKTCIKVHGANTWNDIPIPIKQSPSLDVFKRQLRNYLIESKSAI